MGEQLTAKTLDGSSAFGCTAVLKGTGMKYKIALIRSEEGYAASVPGPPALGDADVRDPAREYLDCLTKLGSHDWSGVEGPHPSTGAVCKDLTPRETVD